jgi:hypothetical protein
MNQQEKPSDPHNTAPRRNGEITPPEFMNWVREWLTNPTRKRFTWVEITNIVLTAVIAAAALGSAWIFEGQLTVMKDTSINSERAWLGVDMGPDPNHPVKISVLRLIPPRLVVVSSYRIKNFGHGPAFKIATTEWVTTDAKDMEEWAKFSCESAMHFTEGTIPVSGIPQPPPTGRMLFLEGFFDKPIGQPESPFVGSGVPDAKFVFFIGCITYKDQFGQSHWTRFAFLSPEWTPRVVLDENVPLHMYGMYNDADDDAENSKANK